MAAKKSKKRSVKAKVDLKGFDVEATVSGRARVTVMAKDAEEAKRKFWEGEYDEPSNPLIEWNYEDVTSVKPAD